MPFAFSKTRLGNAGVTSLEFALIALSFFIMVFAVFDVGWYLIVNQSLATIMAEASRVSYIDVALAPCGTGWSQISQVTPALDPNLTYVCVTQPPAPLNYAYQDQDMKLVQVFVSYPYSPVLPYFNSMLSGGCNPPPAALLPTGAPTTNAICMVASYVW